VRTQDWWSRNRMAWAVQGAPKLCRWLQIGKPF